MTRIPLHEGLLDLGVLDYLSLLWPDCSQQAIQDLFARGRVRSGGKPVAMAQTAGSLADLEVLDPPEAIRKIHLGSPPPEGSGPGIEIIHEDERLIVLSKASGVPVIPDRMRGQESCLGFLIRRELRERESKPPERYLRYRIVHRIDRLTSGLVLVAKTPEAERRMGEDFERHLIRKEYLAYLAGTLAPARITVDCPIAPGRKGRMRAAAADPGARDALTSFEVIERLDRCTLARVMPVTGRTHQIRVHAWAMGHPLAIDPLYNLEAPGAQLERAPWIGRLTLHARQYTLPPGWSEPRSFTCEWKEAALPHRP